MMEESTLVAPANNPALPSRKPPAVADSVARGAFALLSTQPLTWGATLLTVTLGPRLLGADMLGQVTLVGAIATLGSTVAGLGVSEYLVRRVAQRPHSIRSDAGIVLSLQMITAVCAGLLIALFGWLAPHSIAASYPLLLVGLIQMLAAPAQTVLLSSFRGREQHRNYAWFNAAGVVVTAVGSTLVLLAGGTAVMATAAYGSLLIVTTLVGWRLSGLRPQFPALNRSLVRNLGEFIGGGLPFLGWQITLAAYGDIDRLLLGALVPAAELGWYAAAYRIVGMTVFLPTLVINPLFPALSRSLYDPETLRRTITQTLRVLLVVMGGLAAGSIAVAPGIPLLLGWPAEFEGAVPLMWILALHLPVVAADMVLGVVLMAIHRERHLVLVGIVAAVFNISANLVCIPFFQQTTGNGAIGAAIITVLTELLMCIGAAVLIPRQLLDRTILWEVARLTVAGVAASLIGLAGLPIFRASVPFMPVALAGTGLAALVIYIGMAVVLRALTPADVSALRARLHRRSHTLQAHAALD